MISDSNQTRKMARLPSMITRLNPADDSALAILLEEAAEERLIRNAYLRILNEQSATALQELEASVRRNSLVASLPGSRKEDAKTYLIGSHDEEQIGLVASPESMSNFSIGKEGNILFLEQELVNWPFLYKPAGSDIAERLKMYRLKSDPHMISAEDRKLLHSYTQFVFYAVQPVPMIVPISAVQCQVMSEMGKKDTVPPSPEGCASERKDYFSAVATPEELAEKGAEQLHDYYDMLTVAAELLVLEQLGYDTEGFVPERLKSTPSLSFVRSVGVGLFNLATNWVPHVESIYNGTPAARIAQGFRKIKVRKENIFL